MNRIFFRLFQKKKFTGLINFLIKIKILFQRQFYRERKKKRDLQFTGLFPRWLQRAV